VTPDVLEKKLDQLIAEKKTLEKKLEDAIRGGGGGSFDVMGAAEKAGAHNFVARTVKAGDVKELQAVGDSVREALGSGAGVLGAAFEDGKATLLIVVSDSLREKGVSANDLVKAFGTKTGARGGGKPHMAQAGLAAADLDAAIATASEITRSALQAIP
jgi:alanyl-tRNA synthetase